MKSSIELACARIATYRSKPILRENSKVSLGDEQPARKSTHLPTRRSLKGPQPLMYHQ